MTFISRSRFDRQADSDPQPYSRQGCGQRQVIRTVKDRVLSQQARDDFGPEAANRETAKIWNLRLPDLRVQFALFVVEGITSRQPLRNGAGGPSPLASRMLNSDWLAGGSGSRTLGPHRGQHFSETASFERGYGSSCASARTLGLRRNRGQRRKSLIRRINSLMARFNSLLGRNKFPVPLRRELGRKPLYLAPDSKPIVALEGPDEQNSLYFPS